VPFPNSMVDRITPATTDADREQLAERYGVEDRWPVVCEPWTQWVMEDSFASGRPPLENAGVQLVDDVVPYELMKPRLLNAGHQVLAQPGRLAGLGYVHQACGDPVFRRLLEGYLGEEAAPTLAPVPGIDLTAYETGLVQRFSSPAIADTLDRICAEASDRIPQFLLPVLRANLASGGEIRRSVAVLAAWARSAEGADDAGRPIELTDSRAGALTDRARAEDPLAFVADRGLFGHLVDDDRFTTAYRETLTELRTRGVRATLEDLA
jgi:mannitol 2-dehydrogenase